jgi:LPS export ABC transporter protein LptC
MKSRLLIFVIIFGIGALALGWVYESSLRPQEEKVKLVIPDDIDYFLTNVNYRTLDANGELDFQLLSPRLEHYPHNDVSNIEMPSMQIYTGPDPWQIDAITGKFLHAKNILRLREEVVMQKQGTQPMQVYTESIRFELNRDLVTADSDILMISQQARIEAKHAVFDLANKIYKFRKTRSVYHREAG